MMAKHSFFSTCVYKPARVLPHVEKLQLDAARIVTGLPIFTKTDKLYSETGWTTLSSRRHNRKLQLFYNIKNGHAPNYLRELIPPTVQSTTIYPLRNGSDLIIPFCRLSITTESFIPSTVKLWNRLDQFDRNLDTLTKFKKAIRKEQSQNVSRNIFIMVPENLILFLLNFVTRIPF